MQAYLQASVDSLVADGIQHVEARMGLEKLTWYDVGAPVGGQARTFTYDSAADFIVDNFDDFVHKCDLFLCESQPNRHKSYHQL